MSDAFRAKAQHFAQQVISDVQQTAGVVQQVQPEFSDQSSATDRPSIQPDAPAAVVAPAAAIGTESTGTAMEPQAYHEENRLSEFGI